MTGYTPHSRNKCLHCQTTVKFEAPQLYTPHVGAESGESYKTFNSKTPTEELYIAPSFCSECKKTIITMWPIKSSPVVGEVSGREIVIWPITSGRPPCPPEVLENIAQDYDEAALVLQFSAKASAALSRRCLQTMLKDAGKTKEKDLSKQIDEVLPHLPSYISTNLDAVRNIGNFAAHEQKSTNSGMILDVELGEAEWNLDVLESLFDFYYVRPEIEKKKRDDLNKKLKDAGKPEMKIPKLAEPEDDQT